MAQAKDTKCSMCPFEGKRTVLPSELTAEPALNIATIVIPTNGI